VNIGQLLLRHHLLKFNSKTYLNQDSIHALALLQPARRSINKSHFKEECIKTD
jgi:hypothetical protein